MVETILPSWLPFSILLLQVFLMLYGERLSGSSLMLNDAIGIIFSVANAFLWLQPVDNGTFISYGYVFTLVSSVFVVVFGIRMLLAIFIGFKGQVR